MSYNNDYGWGYGQQGGQGQYTGLPEKKKGGKLKVVVGVVVVLLILSAIGGRGKSQGNNTSSPAPVATQPTGGDRDADSRRDDTRPVGADRIQERAYQGQSLQ